MTNPIPARVAERAATRYVENEDGCYISTYSIGSHGYAQIGWWEDGRTYMTTAHRAAWVFYSDCQPADTIDHLGTCDRRCVRGSHLRDIPNVENARRNRPDANPDLSMCLNGHTSERVPRKRGDKVRMMCIDCERDRNHRWKANR